jgi:pyrimidine oxygenase
VVATKSIEVGVFIPVGNNGWIPSTNTPPTPATYEHNKAVTMLAEELGFDFALSMAKWRGFGGSTRHWDVTLESMTAMAGLAEATKRIQVWATVHTMIFHPAVVAKMAATLDQISNGRFGLNLVAGSNPSDQGQMGLWRDLDHAGRYALAKEWITVARRLWTEDRVDFKGEFFELTDCMSNPKPQRIPPIICAGTSDRGFRFTIENCDACFIGASSHDEMISVGRRAKEIGEEIGRYGKTLGLFTIVPGDTDKDAADRVAFYNEGVDLEALRVRAMEYSQDVKENTTAQRMIQSGKEQRAVGKAALVGSPETIADQLACIVLQGDLDGITIIVPDFIEDLRTVGEAIVPLLAERGVSSYAFESMQTPSLVSPVA